MTSKKKAREVASTRQWTRHSDLKALTLSFEGRNEVFPVRPPDISPSGMFINTGALFPEGTVLKVSFRLAKSDHQVNARCEVRYCLRGVGVGVEFIGLSPVDRKAIMNETQPPTKKRAGRPRPKPRPRKRSK